MTRAAGATDPVLRNVADGLPTAVPRVPVYPYPYPEDRVPLNVVGYTPPVRVA